MRKRWNHQTALSFVSPMAPKSVIVRRQEQLWEKLKVAPDQSWALNQLHEHEGKNRVAQAPMAGNNQTTC